MYWAPGWNGAGVAAGRIRALVADPSLALPTRTQACSAWKSYHVILQAEKGKGWLSPAWPPKPHVGSGPPLLSLSSWSWPILPLGSRRTRERGSVRAQLVPNCFSSVGSMSHHFPTA